MTVVNLTFNSRGELLGCCSKGHAHYASSGSDIVCAAVTVLLRTTLQVLLESYGQSVQTDITTRGTLAFRVAQEVQDRARLKYAGDFLRNGIKSLEIEYPQHVRLRENIET